MSDENKKTAYDYTRNNSSSFNPNQNTSSYEGAPWRHKYTGAEQDWFNGNNAESWFEEDPFESIFRAFADMYKRQQYSYQANQNTRSYGERTTNSSKQDYKTDDYEKANEIIYSYSYECFSNYIVNYLKSKGLKIECNSQVKLIYELKRGMKNIYRPFTVKDEIGEAKLSIDNDTVKKILNYFHSGLGNEVKSIEYNEDDRRVVVKLKQTNKKDNIDIDLNFDRETHISYEKLRDIIIDYSKAKGQDIVCKKIKDLIKSLNESDSTVKPFKLKVEDRFLRIPFNLKKEVIEQIIADYLAKFNYKLISVSYNENDIKLKYRNMTDEERLNNYINNLEHQEKDNSFTAYEKKI